MKRRTLMLVILAAAVMLVPFGAFAVEETDTMPVILNQAEYLLYQNVFYNGYADSLTGYVEKEGIFSIVYDGYSKINRYYVWGFLDQTKCCDWQWEFVPTVDAELPTEGSLIRVKGMFVQADTALDGYWIENATVETEKRFTGETRDLNMLTMSDTLERVQILHIQYFPEEFEGKNFSAYARIIGIDKVEDPYYNGSWNIAFSTNSNIPAIGTMVRMRGTVLNGELRDCTLEVMEDP